jgi:hypothetical protein
VSRRTVVLATCACALLTACDRPEGAGQATSLGDSAGVRLVRFQALDGLEVPERTPRERYELGLRPGTELFRVAGARLLPGGVLVVGNAGTGEILRFDETGAPIDRLGREGEGPGEFRDLTALLPGVGDTLVVYDVRLGRLTTFDGAGDLVGTREMHPPSRVVDLKPLAIDADGQVLSVFGDARFFASSGTRRDTTPLLLIDPASRADTLGYWPNAEWSFSATEGGAMRLPVGFGRALYASGRAGRAVLGSSDVLDVVLLDMAGDTLMRIRQTAPNRSVSSDDVERWRSQRLDALPEGLAQTARQAVREAPYHPTYPAFEGLLLDADGRIWIGHTPPWSSPTKAWTVFGPDGEPAWSVTLPASAEVLDARATRVVTLDRDEVDVEIVRVLELDDGGR